MPAGKENRNTIYSIEFDRLNDDMRMVRNRVPTDRESVPTHFTRSYIRLCAMYDSARRVCALCVCVCGWGTPQKVDIMQDRIPALICKRDS